MRGFFEKIVVLRRSFDKYVEYTIYMTIYNEGVRIIQKRNIGLAIIFTILTCGLYGIYWFISITDEASSLSGDNSMSGGMAFLLTIVTCGIYFFFWSYKIGKIMCQAQERAGMMPNDNSILYLILAFLQLSIVSCCIIQSDINNIIDRNYGF
jgi:hypothetical protein